MSKRAHQRAQETVDRAAALDKSITDAVEAARTYERGLDDITEQHGSLRAERSAFERAVNVAEDELAAVSARLAEAQKRLREHDASVADRAALIEQQREGMMRARARAEALVAERRALDGPLAEAQARLEKRAARREAHKATVAAESAPCGNPGCTHCKPKEPVVSPIKISMPKALGGAGADTRLSKTIARTEADAQMRAQLAEKGFKIPTPGVEPV